MLLLQQRDPLHGLRLLQFKVLLHIGLWVAEVAVQGRLTKEVTVVEAEVLLQLARMR
jgi:hypothetical protein